MPRATANRQPAASAGQAGQAGTEETLLGFVVRQDQCLLERHPRLIRPAQPDQEVTARRSQVRVPGKLRLGAKPQQVVRIVRSSRLARAGSDR